VHIESASVLFLLSPISFLGIQDSDQVDNILPLFPLFPVFPFALEVLLFLRNSNPFLILFGKEMKRKFQKEFFWPLSLSRFFRKKNMPRIITHQKCLYFRNLFWKGKGETICGRAFLRIGRIESFGFRLKDSSSRKYWTKKVVRNLTAVAQSRSQGNQFLWEMKQKPILVGVFLVVWYMKFSVFSLMWDSRNRAFWIQ